MFDVELIASLTKVALRVENIDGMVLRRMCLSLERELDKELAAGLGKGAQKVLALLQAHEMEKCTIGLGAVEAKADLVATRTDLVPVVQDRVAIGSLRGVKAICTAPTEQGDVAHVRLEFEAPYGDATWTFLGRNCGVYVQVTFTRRQLELVGAA